ncbi:MAG: hypothetical protein RL223_2171 [Pseudomonadota bacterium]|jgi:signal transduction histidine kinase
MALRPEPSPNLPAPASGPAPAPAPEAHAGPPADALRPGGPQSPWPWSDAALDAVVADARRLAATEASGLLRPGPDDALDHAVATARELLGATVSFLGVVGPDGDVYPSMSGPVPEPLASQRQLRSRTFCHHVLAAGRTLAIDDTRAGPPWCDVPTVHRLGVRAYLGAPLRLHGHIVGTLCGVDVRPRVWSPRDVATLEALAQSLARELQLRGALAQADAAVRARTEARAERDRLVASLVHDLATPVMALQIEISLLRRALDPARQPSVDRLQAALDALKHLKSQLREGVDLQSPVARQALRPPMPVGSLLAQLSGMMTPLAHSQGIVLAVDVRVRAPVAVDLGPMLRVLTNLVGNALKFSPAGSTIRVAGLAPEAGWVGIEVADEGCGMSPDEVARCLERGYIGEASRRRGDGSGLGLAIVREIVEQHGGTVTVRSTEGRGSVFTVRLPLAE